MKLAVWAFFAFAAATDAQEAGAGFDLHGTISAGAFFSDQLTGAPRSGAAVAGGLRAMLYPTLKISGRWTFSGAVQVHSRPYFFEQFGTQNYGLRGDILQAHLTYARIGKNRSLVVRAGQLSSAFGAFLLRYDDAENWLVDMPPAYGYYYKPVTSYGLMGAQVDAAMGRLDMRAQFVNSSPANRRSIFDHDQYGNWAGGVGYTIRQGFRVGASAYRGPYLHRQFAYYFPGEAKPSELPASAVGIDAQWGRGHWNVAGEWQRFIRDYRAIPVLRQTIAYIEARRVLHPRWYVAGRVSYLRNAPHRGFQSFEAAAGFRPAAHYLIKAGWQTKQIAGLAAPLGRTFAVQFITTFRGISIARD